MLNVVDLRIFTYNSVAKSVTFEALNLLYTYQQLTLMMFLV